MEPTEKSTCTRQMSIPASLPKPPSHPPDSPFLPAPYPMRPTDGDTPYTATPWGEWIIPHRPHGRIPFVPEEMPIHHRDEQEHMLSLQKRIPSPEIYSAKGRSPKHCQMPYRGRTSTSPHSRCVKAFQMYKTRETPLHMRASFSHFHPPSQTQFSSQSRKGSLPQAVQRMYSGSDMDSIRTATENNDGTRHPDRGVGLISHKVTPIYLPIRPPRLPPTPPPSPSKLNTIWSTGFPYNFRIFTVLFP